MIEHKNTRPPAFLRWAAFALLLGTALASPSRAEPAVCDGPAAMGISRTIEVDGAGGGVYGSMSRRANHPGFLGKKEVVLTFDDGPMPWITKSILDTLDKACVKATFFSVGRMALAYPATVRDVLARGHSLGTHTFSHPFNMPRMKREKAEAEIEQGFAAVATAAGQPIAPFFRFTGLSDSAALVDYLGKRNVATFTVDVVSNDSYIHDPAVLTKRTITEIEARQGGIILFHDIKTTTAKALPGILAELKARGYTVAHVVPKAPAEPNLDLMASYAPRVAKLVSDPASATKKLPFYGATGPEPVKPAATTPQSPASRTPDATASAPKAKAAAIRGGLDLSQKKDHHPAASVFSAGFSSSGATQPQPDAAVSKGPIWEAMENWAAGMMSSQGTASKP